MRGADDEGAATCGSLKTAEDSGNGIALEQEGGPDPASRKRVLPRAAADPCCRPRCRGQRREQGRRTVAKERMS